MFRILFIPVFLLLGIGPLVAQSWDFLNPTPTGNTFANLCYTGNNTYFATGRYGTLLKSTDGGFSWMHLHTGSETTLTGISFPTPTLGFVCGQDRIFKTQNGGVSWSSQTMPLGEVFRIDFPDPQTGYAIYLDGRLLKTIDGGAIWNIIPTGYTTNEYLYALTFLDAQTGFLGLNDVSTTGPDILRTTDGGITWETVWNGILPGFTSFYAFAFPAPDTGYAIGGNGSFLKTFNGGDTWEEYFSGTDAWLHFICFPESQTGYLDGTLFSGTVIRKTTDGGTSWFSVDPPEEVNLGPMAFSDPLHGVWLGSRSVNGYTVGEICLTTDGANSFTCQCSGYYDDFRCVAFPTAETGYVAGDSGVIVKTTDAGLHWTKLAPATTENLNELFFQSASTGHAVGESGLILKTTDGGEHWNPEPSFITHSLYDITFTEIMQGFVVGDWGTILRTQPSGSVWIPLNSGTNRHLFAVSFPDDYIGYVAGSWGTILKTTNGGETWTEQTTGTTSDLMDICFADEQTGFAVGQYGVILKTTNGGETWEVLITPYYNTFQSVCFRDASTGYCAGEMGLILMTLNGGATWEKQVSKTERNLSGICISEGNMGYAAGKAGTIIGTYDIGVGIAFEEPKGHALRCYPNPASREVIIACQENRQGMEFSIYNLLGEKVLTALVPAHQTCFTMEVSSLPAGVYLIKASRNNACVEVQKLVVTR